MDLTPEQQQRVIEIWAGRKRRQFYLLIPVAIAFILAIICNVIPEFKVGPVTDTGFTYIFLGVVVSVMVYMRFNWRCPACGIYMGALGNPKQCRQCGAKLQNGPDDPRSVSKQDASK
jgi:hypothetical protein